MNSQLLFFLVLILMINLYSLFLMFSDKTKAVNNDRRTPEGVIFFWAICFGSLGVLIGMTLARHKRRKWYFCFGIPLILIQNVLSVLFVYNLLFDIVISL